MTTKVVNCCLIWWFFIGIIVALIGLILGLILLPIIIDKVIAQELVIKENGATWEGWIKPKYKVEKKVYIFNITNYNEVLRNGVKPILKEVGPFGYRITAWKDNLTFTDDGNSIEFIQWRQFHFDPEISCPNCKEDTMLTVPNVLLFSIVRNLQGQSQYAKRPVRNMLQNLKARSFISRKAGELLFHGYDEVILRFAQEPMFKGFLPTNLLDDQLSLFDGLNNSIDGIYKIDTGKQNISNVGKIKTWNGQQQLPESWWSSEGSRMLNGTSGGRFQPNLKMNQPLQMFMSSFFRSLNLDFVREFTYDSRLRAFRFEISPQSFTWSLPWNNGFCNPKSLKYFVNQSATCFPDGIMDISSCKEGDPPISISWPHFLYSEEQVIKSYPNLRADKHRHQSYMELEPFTGALLSMKLRLQVNLGIIGDENVYFYLKNIPTMLVPILWIDQRAEIDAATKSTLINQLGMIDSAYIVCYAVAAFGTLLSLAICIIGALILCLSSSKTSEKGGNRDFIYANGNRKLGTKL